MRIFKRSQVHSEHCLTLSGYSTDNQKDETLSAGGRIVVAVVETLFALLIGAVAVPVIWFFIRVLGLIRPMASLAGGLGWLMFLGGAVFGALAGAISMAIVMAALEEKNKLGLALGAFGGAIGGLCSSVMFFPIVAIL